MAKHAIAGMTQARKPDKDLSVGRQIVALNIRKRRKNRPRTRLRERGLRNYAARQNDPQYTEIAQSGAANT